MDLSYPSLLVFVFGLEFGSFANVCIYRWPRGGSVLSPRRSVCPWCRSQIRWFDNIPLLSYFLLKRRCRTCRSSISFRYPLIEFIMGLGWVLLFWMFEPISGWKETISFLGFLAFYFTLIVTFMTDLDWKIIPDEASFGLIAVGLAVSFGNPFLAGANFVMKFAFSLFGALIGGGVLYVISLVGKFVFKKEAMGGGDIKLLAGLGSILGWNGALTTLTIGALIGGGVSILALVFGGLKRDDYIPFGPFLNVAALITLGLMKYDWEVLSVFY